MAIERRRRHACTYVSCGRSILSLYWVSFDAETHTQDERMALVWANAYTYTYDYGICIYILAKLHSCVPAEREKERGEIGDRGDERGEKEKERERGKQRARARERGRERGMGMAHTVDGQAD